MSTTPILTEGHSSIYFQKMNVNDFSMEYDQFFDFTFREFMTMRVLSGEIYAFFLTNQNELVSILVYQIDGVKAEILNINTLSKYRRQHFARFLLQKTMPLLHLLGVEMVISRDCTQWVPHPEWAALLHSIRAKKLSTPYCYIESPKEFAEQEHYLSKVIDEFTADMKIVYLDNSVAIDQFLQQAKTITGVPNYLHPYNQKYIHNIDAKSMALYDGKEIIGWCLAVMENDTVLVWSAFVREQYRAQSYATYLFAQAFLNYKNYPIRFMIKSSDEKMWQIGQQFFARKLQFSFQKQSFYQVN